MKIMFWEYSSKLRKVKAGKPDWKILFITLQYYIEEISIKNDAKEDELSNIKDFCFMLL